MRFGRAIGDENRTATTAEGAVGFYRDNRIEFTEWTKGNHLRHSRFVGLRSDKKASEVVKEIPALAL